MKVVAFIVCFAVIVVLVLLIIIFTGCAPLRQGYAVQAGGGYYGSPSGYGLVPVPVPVYSSQPYIPNFITPYPVPQTVTVDTGFHPAPLIPKPN
jgi:hypothetical protein